MAKERLIPQERAEGKAKAKGNKKKNKGKSWATSNNNAKFEIIGNDLIARGIIDA